MSAPAPTRSFEELTSARLVEIHRLVKNTYHYVRMIDRRLAQLENKGEEESQPPLAQEPDWQSATYIRPYQQVLPQGQFGVPAVIHYNQGPEDPIPDTLPFSRPMVPCVMPADWDVPHSLKHLVKK